MFMAHCENRTLELFSIPYVLRLYCCPQKIIQIQTKFGYAKLAPSASASIHPVVLQSWRISTIKLHLSTISTYSRFHLVSGCLTQ